ncbi:histidine kinase/DNA gyrase B/HSP90-like ATPase [Roseimicrobium gellanilyticum]|uniref:Histidine kinase/DNA gyrase B/HSP90-like ATPase n=1 Tax=Roseimicrobium gellanilyticum TaxID=748857 RepID=A0A366HV20_9BACT|nr:response regulator [Roseimicrobium gellanilyticum]RBP47947.1 histidine kinase/DNA gyrase B/HSP90-like ATPase [Roseimicrobium gellanilyticum]
MSHSIIPPTPALVLVVDDQPRNLQMLKASLMREGFRVVVAGSGEEALEMLERQQPDLMLLDVMMPGMDGFDVCAKVKSNPATRDIPVIFLTGETQLQSIKKGFEVGGVDYVTKPFNRQEMVARVNTHVELRRAQIRHTATLMEQTRLINIIAQHWLKPLQRLVFLTSQTRNICRSGTNGGEANAGAFAMEAEATAVQMLSSLEDFLHESPGMMTNGRSQPGSITTDDLKAIIENWYVTAIRRQLDFQVMTPPIPVSIAASAFTATQILDPILANAVKAAREQGRISARVRHVGGEVVVEVEDDGPGFSREYLKRPFQANVRATGGSRERQHLGIGLALAKRAADRISAQLELDNLGTGGALVRVTFSTASPRSKQND